MKYNNLLAMPKAELHLHIEGTLEPEMMFQLAQRNKVNLKYSSIDKIKKAYSFNNLQDFLDLYYQGMSVLLTEHDFYDLTYAYLTRASQDNVTHAEIFVDPQAHLDRGISLSIVFNGIRQAITQAEKDFSIKTSIIVCFLRHLSEDNALRSFEKIMDFRDNFIGIGLDSSELGNPPSKFKRVFEQAKKEGLYLVAHAGEEGPVEYISEAIDILGVDRIDHGNAILDDETLIQRIIKDDIALTMCPLSNKCLKVMTNLSDHPAAKLLEKGVKVTINSDDPAYFGGYVNENYKQLAQALKLSDTQIIKLINNSLDAKFI
ncbi:MULTISPECIES: adenosine deaminase [unclassified Francisella]|uniref:adenosine deaminase n=1 Tax=unclassified Francisella TaxID=2610885 RepID=UPI002E33597F|nr:MULTISPECIES: adenosine deaminase [unclassified Francisella]MED7818397.1 adenosine deaminase [Francisella sp. 19S2-4]MED7829233.1 adenosine deaminase [Francisella sp. 19S2-10]